MTSPTDVAVQFFTHEIYNDNSCLVIGETGEIAIPQCRLYSLNLIDFVRAFPHEMELHGRSRQ